MSHTLDTQERHGGPKTAAGKAISRFNAERHAILRETVTDYEKTDAEQLYNDFADDLSPCGRTQELLVEILASNAIRLHRIAKAEAEAMKTALSPDMPSMTFMDNAYTPVVKPSLAEQLMLYSRYQTATENHIYRSLAMLYQLKANEQN